MTEIEWYYTLLHYCRIYFLDNLDILAEITFVWIALPSCMEVGEARQRMELTIINAHWALQNRWRKDLLLFACVQAWDSASARECARAYAGAGFDDLAIGGLVPRVHDWNTVKSIVESVRVEAGDLPLHVFGIGKPDLVTSLFEMGVDSVDSSLYVKLAADGKVWNNPTFHLLDPSPTNRLQVALINLANASNRTLPLSATRMAFSTTSIQFNRSF